MTAEREEGFTLVEVLIAMTLALILVVALLTTLEKSTSTSLAQQRDTQAVGVGEREIERVHTLVKQYGFAALQLSSLPTGVVSADTNPTDPNAFVVGTTFKVLKNWHDTTSATAITSGAPEPLLASAGTLGGVDRLAPGPETFQLGAAGDTGSRQVMVNRYVMRRPDGSCPAGNTDCADDSRRVVVAVRIARSGADLARTRPMFFSTIVNSGVPSNDANTTGGLEIGANLP